MPFDQVLKTWWAGRSLRARLTTLSLGLLGVLLAAFGGSLYWGLRRFLLDGTARRVRAQAKPIVDHHMARIGSDEHLEARAEHLGRALTSRDTHALVLGRHGRTLADGRRLPEEPAPAPPRPAAINQALQGDTEVTYTTQGRAGRSLVALVPLRRAPGSRDILGVAQLTTPLAETDQVLNRQGRLIGAGIVAAFGLGLWAERWLIDAALTPLRRMTHSARRMAAGRYDERLRLPALDDEVGELAAAFDDMATHIESSFASQSRFVAAAAHELRTPLTALRGSLDVLQRGSQDDPVATRRLLQGMQREIRRLSRLTEQLLTLTRLDAPQTVQREAVELVRWLDDFAEQVRLLASDRRLSIGPGPAVTFACDPDLLTQALLNLVHNAVEHTSPGGHIQIDWGLRPSAVEIAVTDDGEGIGPDDQARLFETFYRGDRSRSRRQGGSGLGLAIVAAVMKAHGGEASVISQPGQGSRFALRFPRDGITQGSPPDRSRRQ